MSVTDLDLLTEIGLVLQEDDTFSNGLWSLDEVLAYANQRQYRFLVETQILASFATLGWIPGQPQMPLPPDWITTIAAAWHDFASGRWTPLPASDLFEAAHVTSPAQQVTLGLPAAYRDTDTTETLTIAVDPVPAAGGEVSLIYTGLAEPLNQTLTSILTGVGIAFNIPDDWVPYLKYGVLADMLLKDGRGRDLLRGRYAEQRYQEGIVLAQSLLQGWA